MAKLKINNETLTFNNILYVSPEGDDTGGDGTGTNPFKTMDKTINTAASGDCIYLMEGTFEPLTLHLYPSVSSISDVTGVFIGDDGKELTFISNPNKTKIIIYNSRTNYRDGHCINLYNANSKVINLNFEYHPDLSSNYSNSIFGWTNGQIFNSTFYVPGVTPASFVYGTNNPTIENCVFYFETPPANDYNGSPYYLNCLSNYDYGRGSADNFVVKEYDYASFTDTSEYTENDADLLNSGMGTDPDGTQANIGVWGGTYAWPLPIPISNLSAAGISFRNATLSSEVEDLTDFGTINPYFEYTDNPNLLSFWRTELEPFSAVGTFTKEITGLDPGTTYYYRVSVEIDGKEGSTHIKSFETIPAQNVFTFQLDPKIYKGLNKVVIA
jgi:hypothetical protein